jgi:NADPH-dependent glutamate synthase beta subunit-like oxidoreductase
MKKFKHLNARSLDKAVSVLKNYGRKARIIAGGTDLLGEMEDAVLPEFPEVIVNIKSIEGLDYIKEENGTLRIGALTRLEDIAKNEVIKDKNPMLVEASCRTASPHIREMGTIGGNICQSNRCWYYWVEKNRFNCLRKGGEKCYAINGDARYHSIFGSTRVGHTPCVRACPTNIDIPDYMAKIREGDIRGASDIILKNNPMPAVTGRVCPHFCESGCNRTDYDDAVSVRCVERYLGDYILENPDAFGKPADVIAKKIAVIGSGPAGLTAAYYLNRMGYDVTVFEKMEKAGGLLTYGIPPYRLPEEIVNRQIESFRKLGIRFNTGIKGINIEELAASFDAVFLACGTWKESRAGIKGEELLVSGMEFLRESFSGNKQTPGKKIGVIGGGNVAVDVSRTLLRLGAEPVIIYRRGKEEMPAFKEEVEKAEEEGVEIRFLTQPVEAEKSNGKIRLKCIKMALGQPDESGRPRPEPVEGSEFNLEFDAVMAALGEQSDLSIVPGTYLDDKGRLKPDPSTGNLGANIFAGGDFVNGASTVVQAIASGKKAADNIHIYLGGSAEQGDSSQDRKAPDKFNSGFLLKTSRARAPEVPVEIRIKSLNTEDTGTLNPDLIKEEANRCFNCGCVAVNPSDMAPALIALNADIRTTSRVIKAEDFFAVRGERTTVLDDDEIVTEITIPALNSGTKCKFIKSAIRKSIDFPLVNCAAAIESQDGVVKSARICLNSVYTQPYRATGAERYLTGKLIDESTAQAAADEIMGSTLALLNNRYKIQIARTLVKRAILACQP